MSIFSILRSSFTAKGAPVPDQEVPLQPPLAEQNPTEREAFKSPKLLAEWVGKYVIGGRTLEDDYSLLPDADARKDLEISPEQRDRCLREYSVLRLVGVSLFIKQHHPDTFWLLFTDHATPILWRHLKGAENDISQSELRNALEAYVLACEAADTEKCASLYMERIYDDNPKYMRMKLAGIGTIATDFILSTYEVFRDAYCQVTQGMSYKSFKQITDAIAKVSQGEE